MPKMQSLMAGMQSKGNWLFKKKKTVHKVLAQKEKYTNTGETRVEIVLGLLFFSFVFGWIL